MGREEQKEEREVLDSIYPDEITDISESSYRIAIALEAPSLDEEDETEPRKSTLFSTTTEPSSLQQLRMRKSANGKM